MIPLWIKIIKYNFDKNVCKAILQDGKIIDIDPFVGCALELTDADYNEKKGYDIVGNIYILTDYSVHPGMVLPSEGGMTFIQ